MKRTLFSLYGGVYPHAVGGMEVFNYYLVRELAMKGGDVCYSSHFKYDHGCGRHFKTRNLRPQKLFWPLQDFFILLFHPSIKNLLLSFSQAHWIIWFFFALISKVLRRNLIVVIHHGKSVPQDHHKAYSYFFRTAASVVAVSDDIKKNYDSTFGIDCKVIYPLVPFEITERPKQECRDAYGIARDALVVSMVGTVKDMKNPDTLVRAIAAMPEDFRTENNVCAVFAGGGPMIQFLKELAAELGISDRVVFLGQVPKDKVNEVMKLSDIYLIASDYEGTSVSLLEAMFNQKSIIISRAPGLVDMVKEGVDALAFETRNHLQLCQCIKDIVENPQKAQERVDSASEVYAAKYDYKSVLNKYMEVLS